MALSFGDDSVSAASNAGMGSSGVMRLAAPSLKPSRRFIGVRGVSSELSALSFMEIGHLSFGVSDPLEQRLRRDTLATRQKTPFVKN